MYYQDLLRAFPSSPEVAPVSEVTDSTLSKILLFICSTENKKNISAIYVYPNSIQTLLIQTIIFLSIHSVYTLFFLIQFCLTF